MNSIADRLYAQARIVPIKDPNRVASVTKLESGDLRVTLNSGRIFKIDKEDELLSAFVVYTMLQGT